MEKKVFALDDDALENVTGGRSVAGHDILKFGNLTIGLNVGMLTTTDYVNYTEDGVGMVISKNSATALIEMSSGSHQNTAIQVNTNCGKAGQEKLFYAL